MAGAAKSEADNRRIQRFLLDTNVWRELVDADAVERLRKVSRATTSPILIAPGVVYEMLRTPDQELRRRMIRAVTLRSWERLMTEVFSECADLVTVIRERRPPWIRTKPDLASFHRLRADWSGGRGFWYRARKDPHREAGFVKSLGDGRLEHARRDARDRRQRMAHLNYDSISLKGWRSAVPRSEPGWGAQEVEPWRVIGATSWWQNLVSQPSQPYLDWVGPFVDLERLKSGRASWNRLWGQEVEARELPREWMRWAMGWLQGLRRVTSGTPGDNSIALYACEADVFLTADKAFADILARVRDEAPVPVAAPHRVQPGDKGVDGVLRMVSATRGPSL